jgi:hypothetical protein
MKKIRGDKQIGVIIHINMETSQRNSLCSYFYFKQAKMSCFSFYLFSFVFYRIREQEGRTHYAQGLVGGTSGRGKVVGKGVGG